VNLPWLNQFTESILTPYKYPIRLCSHLAHSYSVSAKVKEREGNALRLNPPAVAIPSLSRGGVRGGVCDFNIGITHTKTCRTPFYIY